MLLCFFLRAEESKKKRHYPAGLSPAKHYPAGLALQNKTIIFKITSIMKWSTIKKLLQIIATVITTILGTNIIQSCM
jgi:hypothetical protein